MAEYTWVALPNVDMRRNKFSHSRCWYSIKYIWCLFYRLNQIVLTWSQVFHCHAFLLWPLPRDECMHVWFWQQFRHCCPHHRRRQRQQWHSGKEAKALRSDSWKVVLSPSGVVQRSTGGGGSWEGQEWCKAERWGRLCRSLEKWRGTGTVHGVAAPCASGLLGWLHWANIKVAKVLLTSGYSIK